MSDAPGSPQQSPPTADDARMRIAQAFVAAATAVIAYSANHFMCSACVALSVNTMSLVPCRHFINLTNFVQSSSVGLLTLVHEKATLIIVSGLTRFVINEFLATKA